MYAIQHLVYNVHEILIEGLNISGYALEMNYTYFGLYLILVGIFYFLIYRFFIKQFKKPDGKYFQNRVIIVLCVFVNLYATVFSIVFRITQESTQTEIFLICLFLDILCCLFTMYLMFYIFRTTVLKDELNIIQSLLKKEKKQFTVSQSNIELMNIKFHDLKHQLTHLSGRIDEDEMNELSKIISTYDIPLTGNEVLDVVITEKKLYCEQEGIELTYMVDGEKLNFMRETDVYSLFGNALDNAINSVKDLTNKDERVVSLVVKETMGLLSIHVENYFQGNIEFQDGLPITKNKDIAIHGFGMKSIKYLVEQYEGEMSIKLDGNIFNLNIVLYQK